MFQLLIKLEVIEDQSISGPNQGEKAEKKFTIFIH
jgi:hypothetical protein